jgi:hypothetical protein
MEKHITLAAALNIGYGALIALGAVALFIVSVMVGIVTGDPHAATIVSTLASLLALFMLIYSAPAIIGGIGLLKRRPWSRVLLMIASVLALIKVPFGTALGIYTIWVLIDEDTKRILAENEEARQPGSL